MGKFYKALLGMTSSPSQPLLGSSLRVTAAKETRNDLA